MAPAIVAGLGNPGKTYADTRHNLGFRVLDALANRSGTSFRADSRINGTVAKTTLAGRTTWLLKPLTFMNESGVCIGALVAFLKLPVESLLVVHDDITLETGAAKLSTGGGTGGHNGVASILQHLPANSFARLRIGIGGKHWPEQELTDHVLGKLTEEEQTVFSGRLATYIQNIETWLEQGTAKAQNFINKKQKQ
ncbi:MAG: aminoacyl-tRNA hydrolase [Puniceicoccales bacterium]|jgi:PTH1 family peptidyl-tRNA hydrolase|nr:aminoacyl-tRNA hydrolase [Puniceicoccales bacterium]